MIYPRQIIRGKIPSKSNSYKIITIAGHASLGKTTATKDYEKSFYLQCSLRDAMISKPFKLTIDVYFESNLPDLDNSLKVALDCLQTCKAIKNDRWCCEIVARKLIDKGNPRIEFEIEELL